MNNEKYHKEKLYGAIAIALIAGLFASIAATKLWQNHPKANAENMVKNFQWQAMLQQLAEQPGDEKSMEEIRLFDLQLRQEYFDSQAQNKKYTFLLIIGGIIFFVSLHRAGVYYKKTRKIKPFDNENIDEIERQLSFQLVIAMAVILTITGVWLGLSKEKIGEFTIASGTEEAEPEAEIILADFNQQWPSFRGPGGQGIVTFDDIAKKWDSQTGENILWKTATDLPGHNSPIVWENRIFFAGADEETRKIYCLDAENGQILWERTVQTGQNEVPHIFSDTGYAAPTMATNGQYVSGIFANGDLVCFDFDGKQIWIKNLGLTETTYGYASSLAVYQDILIVQYDQGFADEGKSEMLGFDIKTGNIRWRQKREVNNSWSSPVVLFDGQSPRLITTAEPYTICNDPLSGQKLWKIKSVEADVAPTAVYGGGIYVVIAPNYYAKAIEVVNGTPEIKWEIKDYVPDTCSPLANDKYLWMLTSYGQLACFDIKTGQQLWVNNFEQEFMASPVLVDDMIYLTSYKGETFIVKATNEFELVGSNKLYESVTASPAFGQGRIYIRSQDHLYAISENDIND